MRSESVPVAPADDAAYDEAFDADGRARPHYAALMAALGAADLEALRAAVDDRLTAAGVTFGAGVAAAPFQLDPVPRVLPAEEWRGLAAGLEQRMLALNAFLVDAYGERRMVDAGLIAAEVIDGAEGYEPELQGRFPGGAAPAGVAGLDVVRDADGALLVLEDNLRTPSGLAYAVAARSAVDGVLPAPEGGVEELGGPLFAALRSVLREAAPSGSPCSGEPSVVVLSDGPEAAGWWEHAELARRIGAPVVTLDELERRDGRVWARAAGDRPGPSRPVDVVYRRCDEDRLRDERGALTAVGEALLEPWLHGLVAVVNAFGTGLGDDKLVHAHVEDMVRFYLGEEPLVRSVETLDLGQPAALEEVLGGLRRFVVKPRAGAGGAGVVVCEHAEEHDLERLAAQLAAEPGASIAQRTVPLSRHPTVVDGRLEPRHVDLRPYVLSTASTCRAAPGGLTRVAWDRDALVVNSHQNGGCKATWVLR
jgi:uncharacterized circularly permuted ATP-grasp superfamily protein